MYDVPSRFSKDLRLSMIRGRFGPLCRPASKPDGTARPSPQGEDRALTSPPLEALPGHAGGADRARTGDPLVANQVLSQLSYSPEDPSGLVGLSGFEPLTSRLSAVRSSQLSYRPVVRQRPAARPRSGTRGGGSQRASPGPKAWRVAL